MIPYGRQQILTSDIEAVIDTLSSDFITQGPQIQAFEQAIAQACHAPYAVAISSATAGLHLACLALGVGSGDLVWTVPNTFVASANCAVYCGADIDFVDIDVQTGLLSIDALHTKLTQAKQQGRLPKVLIPVHFGGASCDMRSIHALAQQYGFFVIEDASHAIGARYHEQPVGSSLYADLCVFSFHPVKIITTAEGGVVTTRHQALAERLLDLRTHGITRDAERLTRPDEGPWYYEQQTLGFNYRITDLQAALGVAQTQRLHDLVAQRQALAARYRQAFDALGIVYLKVPESCYSSYHLFVLQIPAEHRKASFIALREAGIGVNVHYIPVHWQPYYRDLGFQQGQFPQAELYYRQAISLPLFPDLSMAEQDFIIEQVYQLQHTWS